jgi:hypothetical protein
MMGWVGTVARLEKIKHEHKNEVEKRRNTDVNGKIILEAMLQKWSATVWIWFNWSSGQFL